MNRWKVVHHASSKHDKTGVTMPTEIKTKSVPKYQEGHFITIKGAVYQEDLIIINVYVPNNAASTYMKKN